MYQNLLHCLQVRKNCTFSFSVFCVWRAWTPPEFEKKFQAADQLTRHALVRIILSRLSLVDLYAQPSNVKTIRSTVVKNHNNCVWCRHIPRLDFTLWQNSFGGNKIFAKRHGFYCRKSDKPRIRDLRSTKLFHKSIFVTWLEGWYPSESTRRKHYLLFCVILVKNFGCLLPAWSGVPFCCSLQLPASPFFQKELPACLAAWLQSAVAFPSVPAEFCGCRLFLSLQLPGCL